MEANLHQISFLQNAHCSVCGYPVIDACCNAPFTDFIKDGQLYDYWQYCTNKSCVHHEGDGIGYYWADWVELETNEQQCNPKL